MPTAEDSGQRAAPVLLSTSDADPLSHCPHSTRRSMRRQSAHREDLLAGVRCCTPRTDLLLDQSTFLSVWLLASRDRRRCTLKTARRSSGHANPRSAHNRTAPSPQVCTTARHRLAQTMDSFGRNGTCGTVPGFRPERTRGDGFFICPRSEHEWKSDGRARSISGHIALGDQ